MKMVRKSRNSNLTHYSHLIQIHKACPRNSEERNDQPYLEKAFLEKVTFENVNTWGQMA